MIAGLVIGVAIIVVGTLLGILAARYVLGDWP